MSIRQVIIGLGCCALTTGCIRRTEVVLIHPDGRLDLAVVFEGDVEDVTRGSAAPAGSAGWSVRDKVETDQEGRKKMLVAATRRVHASAAIPDTYMENPASSDGQDLHFPTTVRVERRADGVYYHFRRVYEARVWARLDYGRQQIMEQDSIKSARSKAPKDLTEDERKALAEAIVKGQAEHVRAMFALAFERAGADIPQDAQLAAMQSVHTVYLAEALMEQVMAIVSPETQPADDEGDRLEQELRLESLKNVERTLEAAKVAPAEVGKLLAAYEHIEATYKLTEDLNDEEWVVAVAMPGTIVAHNAPSSGHAKALEKDLLKQFEAFPELSKLVHDYARADFAPGYQQVGWKFDGEALHDRDVVLMATSFVPADQAE